MTALPRDARSSLHRLGTSLAPMLLIASFALPVSGQDDARLAKTDLVGFVVDQATGEPIAGAYVQVVPEDRSAYTDSRGHFKIVGLPVGRYALYVEYLGYSGAGVRFELAEDAAPARIELAPNPVILEGIQVINNRLKRRRNALAYSSRVFDARQLATSSAGDALDFVRMRVFMTPCPSGSFSRYCIWRRGQSIAPAVYVDEVPFIGGMDMLIGYGTQDLYLIEVLNQGTQIRLYTKWFAERLAQGRASLSPFYN
jgi:hypothetical protein